MASHGEVVEVTQAVEMPDLARRHPDLSHRSQRSTWRSVERHLTQKFGHAENKRVKPIGRGPHKAVVFHGVSRANGPKRHTSKTGCMRHPESAPSVWHSSPPRAARLLLNRQAPSHWRPHEIRRLHFLLANGKKISYTMRLGRWGLKDCRLMIGHGEGQSRA